MQIKNKTAVITGASKGIGRTTALHLAEEGARVAISARSPELLEQTAEQIRTAGGECFTFAGDMTDESQIKLFVEKVVGEFGGIDILVNNAGLGIFKPIAEMRTSEWDEMFNLNVRGLFLMTRESLPLLREAGESVVVNVASLAGKNTFVNGGGYTATKHAVIAFSRCLMLEERKNNMRVLVICPGSVDTPFSNGRLDPSDPKRKRILKPEDVADSIIHMIKMPQRAMISEIDIRPSNP